MNSKWINPSWSYCPSCFFQKNGQRLTAKDHHTTMVLWVSIIKFFIIYFALPWTIFFVALLPNLFYVKCFESRWCSFVEKYMWFSFSSKVLDVLLFFGYDNGKYFWAISKLGISIKVEKCNILACTENKTTSTNSKLLCTFLVDTLVADGILRQKCTPLKFTIFQRLPQKQDKYDKNLHFPLFCARHLFPFLH